MSFEKEPFRIPIDEELGDEAKALTALRHQHHGQRAAKWSRVSRFFSSRTAIAVLLVTNFALFAQCIGLWTFIHPRSNHSLVSTQALDAVALDRIPSSATWIDTEVGNSTAKRTMTTALTEPSVSCDLCPAGDDFCMELGYHNIARSVVFEGSNERVHAFLRKLESGQAVSVGIIGGSVSHGHSLGREAGKATNEVNGPLNMHRQVMDWINTKYPNPNHKYTNGAVPATGSLYFSTCFAEHIPEDVDIVFIELAINDVRHVAAQIEYEQLLRAVLDLPNKPAVVNMHVFALIFDPISQGGDQHLGVASLYDTPVVSSRSLILPLIFEDANQAERFFSTDPRKGPDAPWNDRIDGRHYGAEGHRVMANLTRIYFERQLCKMRALASLEQQGFQPSYSAPNWPSRRDVGELPKMFLSKQWHADTVVPKFKPLCLSTISEKHPLVPSESFGWTFWNWKEKRYLVGRVPGATVSIPFEAAMGEVKVYYQRSSQYGLGQVDCWVDDNVKGKKRLDGYWIHGISIIVSTTIVDQVTPGKHVLHCEVVEETNDKLSGGHEFRITSVTAL